MLIMVIVTIVICLLFTVAVISGVKKNPTSGLYNLPLDIQERVHSLPEYQGKLERILSTKERIVKKLPVVAVLLIAFAGIVYAAGARTFLQGFGYAFGLWTGIKLYVTLVINCGWYAHTSSGWVPGTEDMKASYQNYGFYLSSIPRSLLVGAMVGLIIGVIMAVV